MLFLSFHFISLGDVMNRHIPLERDSKHLLTAKEVQCTFIDKLSYVTQVQTPILSNERTLHKMYEDQAKKLLQNKKQNKRCSQPV